MTTMARMRLSNSIRIRLTAVLQPILLSFLHIITSMAAIRIVYRLWY